MAGKLTAEKGGGELHCREVDRVPKLRCKMGGHSSWEARKRRGGGTAAPPLG